MSRRIGQVRHFPMCHAPPALGKELLCLLRQEEIHQQGRGVGRGALLVTQIPLGSSDKMGFIKA